MNKLESHTHRYGRWVIEKQAFQCEQRLDDGSAQGGVCEWLGDGYWWEGWIDGKEVRAWTAAVALVAERKLDGVHTQDEWVRGFMERVVHNKKLAGEGPRGER